MATSSGQTLVRTTDGDLPPNDTRLTPGGLQFETLTDSGDHTTFAISQAWQGSKLLIFNDGAVLKLTNDYTTSGLNITLNQAAASDSWVIAIYIPKSIV